MRYILRIADVIGWVTMPLAVKLTYELRNKHTRLVVLRGAEPVRTPIYYVESPAAFSQEPALSPRSHECCFFGGHRDSPLRLPRGTVAMHEIRLIRWWRIQFAESVP